MGEDLVAVERIEPKILVVRGQRVLLDADLAALYGVETRTLNQAVRRNRDRFPLDFTFQMTAEEAASLRSQIVISNVGRGGRRYLPFAFTEHGALMAANVLNSRRAVEMGVFVVRAFVRMREVLAAHGDLARRIDEHDRKLGEHGSVIGALVDAVKALMAPPGKAPRRIGFHGEPSKEGTKPSGRARGR